MIILIKFIKTTVPIKKIILNLGLIFIGMKTKNINNKIKIIFSDTWVYIFLIILWLFKILSIIWACIWTPGTTFPFAIFTMSNRAWAEDPIKIILFSILFLSKLLLMISIAEI